MIKHFIFLFFIFTLPSLAQTIVSGNIFTDKKEPLAFANVVLKPENSNAIVAYCFANEDGFYELKTAKTGTFTLVISALSYKPFEKSITLNADIQTITQNATLVYEEVSLNEVIVTDSKPITQKKDTIVFDVKKFITGNEQVVEDILKKLPGINVTSDGTIKIGNKEVEKVMIENDDLFERGYKILTKNMPSAPIEKVEILEHYSNNKHLKGVENSDKVALNLTLKDDAKRQWFGNASLGYGLVSENVYETKANLMNFGKKNKYYFFTNLNNIGTDATGDINHLIYSARWDEPSTIGDQERINPLLTMQGYVPEFKEERTLLNNAELLSLNAIFNPSKKVKLKTIGFLLTDEHTFQSDSYQTYQFNAVSFENYETNILRKKMQTGFGKMELSYDISKTKTFEFISKINATNDQSKSDNTFNNASILEKLETNSQLFDQKIIFTTKPNPKKVWITTGRYINQKEPQNSTTNSPIYNSLFNTPTATNTQQSINNRFEFLALETHYFHRKKSDNLWEIKIGNSYRKDKIFSNFLLNDNEILLNQPLDFQNNTVYSTLDLYGKIDYSLKLKKFLVTTSFDVHQLFNQLQNFSNKNTQNPFYINPSLGVEYKINHKNKLTTNYTFSTANATATDVLPYFYNSGFRNFEKGTGTFNQTEATSTMLNYTFGNWGDKFFANTFVLYTKNHDFFSTNSVILPDYTLAEKILIKNREMYSFSTNIDKYFSIISSNLKLKISGSKSNYKNSINGSDLRNVDSKNITYRAEIRSGFRGFFNYHLGLDFKTSNIQTTTSNNFTNSTAFLDLMLKFSDKLYTQIQTERYSFGNLETNNKYYFLDFETRYTIKENKLTVYLAGNNLFNVNTFNYFYISDISTSKTQYRLQPRYLMLKIDFRF